MRKRRSAKPILLLSIGLFFFIAVGQAVAEETPCPLPGQKHMLIVQMCFVQTAKDHGANSAKAWRSFLRRTVTPRFPDGFTVYDADGQWTDPRTKSIKREKTKVLMIAAEDTPVVLGRIEELSRAYKTRFRQKSVGIVANPGCGAF